MTAAVTIVVLNWNGREDTLACLASLQQVDYARYDVVVVDNGSGDGSVEAIRERWNSVTLICNQQNLGFCGGNNVGLRLALERGADHVLLLNNDTEVAPDFLGPLVQALADDPSVGVAGPSIYYHQRPTVLWSAGGAIDWRSGKTRMMGLDEPDRGQFGAAPREVDFVTGCAMLLRRAALERAGLLDERFFAYYEEAEWCVRIRRAGFRIVHVPSSRLWHKIHPDQQLESPTVHYYMTRNRLLFLRLCRAGPGAWMHTLLADYLRTLVSWSVRPRWRERRALRPVMLRALADAARGRWGERQFAVQ